MAEDADYDWIIIGSGFGGSVSALRLCEKGYRVLMLEKGRELKGDAFPKTNWNIRKWLWAPSFGFRGLFKMTFFRHVTVLSGVGVGGGSLVYANTLPIPKTPFYKDPAWGHLADWEHELAPHYQTARRMLGATRTPVLTPPDRLLREIARERGQPEAFESTMVGVFFGKTGSEGEAGAGEASRELVAANTAKPGETVADPYFEGFGPERTACNMCGACMTGCRFGAKNSLDKNYLYLARKLGLELQANTEVTAVRERPGGGYVIEAKQGDRAWFRKKVRFTAKKVIFAGGVLGTTDLLLRMKQDPNGLPRLPDTLGHTIRTNSESLIGVTAKDTSIDMSKGIAIGSILQTDERSHLEPVRYGSGSNFFKLLGAPHVGGDAPGIVRFFQGLGVALRHPREMLRVYTIRDWAASTIILLYMRTDEGTLRFRRKGLLFRRTGSDLETGRPPTASLPEATALAERVGEKVGGMPTSIVTETVLNIPTTAHILGGACMGADASAGVIDHQHRIFNYDGLYVIDGAAISANPGVNPSLTITALAERAMTFIPPKAGVEPKPLPPSARSAGPSTEGARVASATDVSTSAA